MRRGGREWRRQRDYPGAFHVEHGLIAWELCLSSAVAMPSSARAELWWAATCLRSRTSPRSILGEPNRRWSWLLFYSSLCLLSGCFTWNSTRKVNCEMWKARNALFSILIFLDIKPWTLLELYTWSLCSELCVLSSFHVSYAIPYSEGIHTICLDGQSVSNSTKQFRVSLEYSEMLPLPRNHKEIISAIPWHDIFYAHRPTQWIN